MKQQIVKMKIHVRKNKKVYIAVGTTFVVTAVGAYFVSGRVKVSQKAVNAALVNWRPSITQEQITIVELPARGHRGNVIWNKTANVFYGSENEAAKILNVSRTTVAKHLDGLCDDIHGNILVNLGENLSEQVKLSV